MMHTQKRNSVHIPDDCGLKAGIEVIGSHGVGEWMVLTAHAGGVWSIITPGSHGLSNLNINQFVRIIKYFYRLPHPRSMAELAGLIIGAVGLLPVVAQGIQGYSMLRETLHQCRECTTVLRSVETQVQVQEGRFRNNSELILHLVAREYKTNWEMRAMIENPKHALWMDAKLNDRLRQTLSRNYGHCESIIESTKETLQDVQNALYCFDIIRAKRQKVSLLRTGPPLPLGRVYTTLIQCWAQFSFWIGGASTTDIQTP